MIATFYGKKVTGMLAALPQNVVPFEDEVSNYSFSEKQTLRLKKIMGYKQHRIAKPKTATSDLCIAGMERLLSTGKLNANDIGALIVVTITPDHFMPHTSNIVQSKCNLPHSVLCMDISQGCAGFLVGLLQAFMLLEHLGNKKVILINADVLSHKVSKADRNSYPLIGDCASIAVVENVANWAPAYLNIYMDGSRGGMLEIPAGGSRMPCTIETARLQDDGEGNLRSLDNMRMDGAGVFQFVQTDVPPMITETLEYAKVEKEDINWFLFHQPNRFMLRKLVEKLEVPTCKVPMDEVENFGNPSGASIPLLIASDLAETMLSGNTRCCLSAFGEGLCWGAIVLDLGGMDFCEMLVTDC